MYQSKNNFKLKVRNSTNEDIDQILEIDSYSFGKSHWSKATFKSEFKSSYSRYFTITPELDDAKVLGYAGFWKVGEEGHITTIAICSEFRKQGLADILLYEMIKCAQRNNVKWLTLEVRTSNVAAIALYEKYVFKKIGIRNKYYQDNNEDALILWTDDIQSAKYNSSIQNIIKPMLSDFSEVV